MTCIIYDGWPASCCFSGTFMQQRESEVQVRSAGEATVIDVNMYRCGWAWGRLLFLLVLGVIFLVAGAGFLWVGLEPAIRWPALIFGVLFMVASLMSFMSCIMVACPQTITINQTEMIIAKPIGFVTWRKRIERSRILAIALGHEDDNSIETVSIICQGRWPNTRTSVIMGWLLDAAGRHQLYEALMQVEW